MCVGLLPVNDWRSPLWEQKLAAKGSAPDTKFFENLIFLLWGRQLWRQPPFQAARVVAETW